jgi:hypothetical protein
MTSASVTGMPSSRAGVVWPEAIPHDNAKNARLPASLLDAAIIVPPWVENQTKQQGG